MHPEQIQTILAKPIAQELLSSNIPARLAYTGLDGFPRVIPIAYIVEGDQVKLFSPVNATKVPSLRENPNVAITIDTTGQTPPHILLIRGVASIEIVDGVPQGFLDASQKQLDPRRWSASKTLFVGSTRRWPLLQSNQPGQS